MQLKVLFGRKSHGRSCLLRRYVYTNVDNREELERVIENKGDEFRRKKNMEIQSGGEKTRNASGQQGENERQ